MSLHKKIEELEVEIYKLNEAIAKLKQQLASSVRVHPMSELPGHRFDVVAILRNGTFIFNRPYKGEWLFAEYDYIGWIDPREVGK